MSKSNNTFKNANTTNAVYSEAPEISDIRFVNGVLSAKITGGLDNGDKLLGFDQAVRVTGVKFNCISGTKAAQAFTVYRGTASVATAKLAILRPVAPNTPYSSVSFYPNKADIPAGGALTFTVSGTAATASMTGHLLIETIPN